MRLPVTTENGITGLLLRYGKFPGSGLNENAVSIGSVLGSQAMYYIGTGKCALCRRFIRIFGTLLFGYLHTYKTFRYKIMIAVSVTQPAIGITRQFCAEWRFVYLLSHHGDGRLARTVFTLKKGGLRRILRITVTDARTQANDTIIEAESGLACHKVWSEILIIGLFQLHRKHTVTSLQRGSAGKVLGRTRH